uniref:Uncharacterized protein n=1 Tax=Polytomella parva TaxID=51329 RepID=A0A7S0UJZ4_9CHLO|mmetsp:Transcript_11950/g.21435  ORF Transcript_11950/g.21435 Transcript_11950/m.21435 type:complete len:298 (+) Transcript_11950:101-994(+)
MSARQGFAFAARVARTFSGAASSSSFSTQVVASKMSHASISAACRNTSSLTSLSTFASKGALSSRGSFASSVVPPVYNVVSAVNFSTNTTTVSNTNPIATSGQSGVTASTESSSDEPTATAPTGAPKGSSEEEDEDETNLKDAHYLGPLSYQHKLLKMISITNTAVAFGAAPYIIEFADVSMASRYGLAASLVFFGMITTGALHWVARPYVHEMRFTASTGIIETKTTTLFGRSKWDSFNLSDVQPLPWSRPVATFMAKDKFYYIDVFNFPKGELRRRLMPSEDSIPKGFKDDEDDD